MSHGSRGASQGRVEAASRGDGPRKGAKRSVFGSLRSGGPFQRRFNPYSRIMPDWFYRTVSRPFLFQLEAETARSLVCGLMGRIGRLPGGLGRVSSIFSGT